MSGQEAEAAVYADPALSRKLSAVLSLPVKDSAEAGQTGATSFWPPKAWTEAGRLTRQSVQSVAMPQSTQYRWL